MHLKVELRGRAIGRDTAPRQHMAGPFHRLPIPSIGASPRPRVTEFEESPNSATAWITGPAEERAAMYIDTLERDPASPSADSEPANAPELLAEIGLSTREIRDVLPPLWIGPADNIRPEFE